VDILPSAENPGYLVVQAQAPVPWLVDIAEQLAWLGEALSASFRPDTWSYSRASCTVESLGDSADDYTTFCISYNIKADEPPRRGGCWESLFSNPSIAYDFPTRFRDHDEVGMEMTLDVMITLGEITSTTSFNDKFMLKGFSSAFYPTQLSGSGSSAVWHFLCKDAKEDNSYLTCFEASLGCLTTSTALDGSWMYSARHFVGWTPESFYKMGKFFLFVLRSYALCLPKARYERRAIRMH
jgi:hypothetical protein